MKTMIARGPVVVLALLAGCGELPTFSDPWGGHLTASVSGDTSFEYSSEAVFRLFRNPYASGYPDLAGEYFNVHSRGIGASSGSWLVMEMPGGRPAVATYPVELGPRRSVFSLLFNHEPYGSVEFSESFATVEGEIAITVSRSNRLVGQFDVLAARYCRTQFDSTGLAQIGSCDRYRIDADAPVIRIEGSFDVPRVANVGEVVNDVSEQPAASGHASAGNPDFAFLGRMYSPVQSQQYVMMLTKMRAVNYTLPCTRWLISRRKSVDPREQAWNDNLEAYWNGDKS
jgi:hypothetical protein